MRPDKADKTDLHITAKPEFDNVHASKSGAQMDVCGCAQVVLRHGQLHMCRNQEMVRSGKDGRGLFIVINGLVRIGYRDPLGNTQEYFLGTGAHPHAPTLPVTAPCSSLSWLLKLITRPHH